MAQGMEALSSENASQVQTWADARWALSLKGILNHPQSAKEVAQPKLDFMEINDRIDPREKSSA